MKSRLVPLSSSFAEVLQHHLKRRMEKEQIDALYRRASAWYAEEGMILEAVEAAMAGRCYEQAASLLDVQGLPMAQGYPHERFLTWIKQIPADVLIHHPQLEVWQAAALIMLGELQQLAEAFSVTIAAWRCRAGPT